MSEEGARTGFPDVGPVVPKPGWYRNRDTGQRRYWDGATWIDVSNAVTPFTVEPQQSVDRPTPALLVRSPRPMASGWRRINARTKVIAGLAALFVTVLAIAIDDIGNNTPVRGSVSHAVRASPPAPAAATVPFDPGITLPLTTTTAAADDTTTTPPATQTTTPLSTLHGGYEVSRAAIGNPARTADTVAIIGDSITGFAVSDLEHALRHDDLFVDAVAGSKMVDHLATIELLEHDGQTRDWVIELGTNDAYSGNTNWLTDFSNEVSALQSQPCVVFLTVNPRLSSISSGINDAITNAVASHPNFHSIDWGTIEFHRAGWLRPDGIHPTTSGVVELVKLEHKAILGCRGA